MKKLFFIILISTSSLAEVTPSITSGEVKILYPCEVSTQLPLEKEERETITFFDDEKFPYYHSGFIFRRRVNQTTKESDFTVKFRTHKSLTLDEKLFTKLSEAQAGKLKCEFDVSYDKTMLKPVYSCSLKTETSLPTVLHEDLVLMIKSSSATFPRNLLKLNQHVAKAQSWKLKVLPELLKKGPFKKAPAVEKWVRSGECLVEISGKINTSSADPGVVHQEMRSAFDFLLGLIPFEPAKIQGAKTRWVLGIR